MFQPRYVLLPILGAIAAVVAFKLAAPYEATLGRGLDIDDPRALFTFGTAWGAVNRLAFGAFICGPFAFALTVGRRTLPRALMAGLIGSAVGAGVNFVTDSGADILGLALTNRVANLGSIVAMVAWCALVPIGIAATVTFAIGITQQRITRAIYAARMAAMISLFVQVAGGTLAGVQSGGGESAGEMMRSQIPVWRMVEIAVGFALGIIFAMADDRIRLGSVRLIYGRNEFRDWSLDFVQNRVGSAEGNEIPLYGIAGVAPEHALIVRQGAYFYLDPRQPVSVNGTMLSSPVALNSGDQIGLGSAKLVFYSRDLAINSQFATAHPPYQTVAPVQTYAPASSAKLKFDKTGQELRLPPGRYGVGRDASNAVCLDNDSRISRHHAELVVTTGGMTLIDLGSKNGTLLNGARLNGQANLNPGDVVQFGSARFTYSQ